MRKEKHKQNYGYKSSGWELGGLASGLLLSLVGTGIITGIAACSNPEPNRIPDDVFKECYKKGYTGKARSKNVLSALYGGIIGTCAAITITCLIISNSH